ncbi:MAG TPA: hypothetical protein VFI68_00025 [Anaerolineales bacterium]|nr:hypothetical protein [Anaerolineales bacterium]
MPMNNRPFWEKKLRKNKVRDQYVTRVWEHELKSPQKVVDKLVRALVTARD